jgi:hypothetical protein
MEFDIGALDVEDLFSVADACGIECNAICAGFAQWLDLRCAAQSQLQISGT